MLITFNENKKFHYNSAYFFLLKIILPNYKKRIEVVTETREAIKNIDNKSIVNVMIILEIRINLEV